MSEQETLPATVVDGGEATQHLMAVALLPVRHAHLRSRVVAR